MSAELTGKLETERKFDVDLDFALPALRDLGGSAQTPAAPPEVERLIARYHDTDDLRLAAAGVTLRRRTGGRDSGWHLKLPVGGDTRREVHAPLGDGNEPVPAGLAELVATWAGGRALRPVATLETTRTVWQITRPDATRFARPCWPGAKSRSSWFPARPRSWRRLASGCASQVRRHPGQRTS